MNKLTIKNEVNGIAEQFEIAGNFYYSLHHLNPNVKSEKKQLDKLKEKAELNNMLKIYGYKDRIMQ